MWIDDRAQCFIQAAWMSAWDKPWRSIDELMPRADCRCVGFDNVPPLSVIFKCTFTPVRYLELLGSTGDVLIHVVLRVAESLLNEGVGFLVGHSRWYSWDQHGVWKQWAAYTVVYQNVTSMPFLRHHTQRETFVLGPITKLGYEVCSQRLGIFIKIAFWATA